VSLLNTGLRVDGTTVAELLASVNGALSRLLGQDRRRWNLEPARKPILTVTTGYAALEGDMVIRVEAGAAPVTVSLPPAVNVKGLHWWIKKVDGSANAVTVAASGSDLIDGAASVATTTPYTVLRLLSHGSGWDLL